MRQSFKKSNPKYLTLLAILVIAVVVFSCEYEKIVPIQPPKPKVAVETPSLEAEFVSPVPVTVNDAFWKTARYTVIETEDIETENLYEEGKLNMTGTYNGKASFNKGEDPELIVRAAYDSTKISIMIEWMDSDMDASFESLLFNGDKDSKKEDTTEGWTSQRNSDNVVLAFHNKNGSLQQDIWQWNLALSEPLGYAIDKHKINDEIAYDAGNLMFTRNAVEPGNPRSLPLYEWNGTPQNITKSDNTETILDPGFFIYDDYKTEFMGDAEIGDSVYTSKLAKCAECHGEHGEGNAFGSINAPGSLNGLSRSVMDDFLRSSDHTGSTYYKYLNQEQIESLIARLYGMGGVPGYILSQPDGSSADLITSSDVILAKVKKTRTAKYKVLIVRDLTTSNEDDIVFDPFAGTPYLYDIYLSDNDEINKIGSVNDTLTFIKPTTDE